MSIKSDRWIRRMAKEHGMIEPFVDGQVRQGVVLSDGDDTASLIAFDDVMELAKQSGMSIYTIKLKLLQMKGAIGDLMTDQRPCDIEQRG